ncbi:MAG: high frequency lysogenization protein HflD [Candidatus Competibacterales bacterium]|nr:high frequency lysogenization protein HflD [Candidatus Competibacterales bacterium]
MADTDRDRAIALAGLFQATGLVNDIAQEGQCDGDDFAAALDSLFKIDADDTEDVYGGLERLRTGLILMDRQLSQPQNRQLTQYVLQLMLLERKLARQPRMLAALRQGVEETRDKLGYFPATHDNIIARLAELYSNTISTLKPRIMVNGHYQNLSRADNANRIRTLLLAGIRSAVLWHQCGGSRLKLLFARKRLLLEARRLLASLEDPPATSSA